MRYHRSFLAFVVAMPRVCAPLPLPEGEMSEGQRGCERLNLSHPTICKQEAGRTASLYKKPAYRLTICSTKSAVAAVALRPNSAPNAARTAA